MSVIYDLSRVRWPILENDISDNQAPLYKPQPLIHSQIWVKEPADVQQKKPEVLYFVQLFILWRNEDAYVSALQNTMPGFSRPMQSICLSTTRRQGLFVQTPMSFMLAVSLTVTLQAQLYQMFLYTHSYQPEAYDTAKAIRGDEWTLDFYRHKVLGQHVSEYGLCMRGH